MAICVTHMVKVYFIPTKLIVNIDQIGLHVVPNGSEIIQETKGPILEMNGNRHVKVVISISTNEKLLPTLVISTRTTTWSLSLASVG